MRKTIWKHIIYALFLSLMVMGCSGIFGAINGSNATYAKNVITLSPVMPVYGADLTPTSLYITLGDCYHGSIPSLAGTRWANFSYKVWNIGGIISPNFFIIIVEQAGFLGGGGSPTLIPAGQFVSEIYGTYVPTGGRFFTLTVYPLNPQYYQIGGYWLNYVNRTLDANPGNNTIHYKIDIPACP